jgi:8-amino-7-oxononanoate synthase
VLNGTYAGHMELEKTIAEFYGTTGAIVFSTGYQANLGMMSTLAGPKDFILIDADCHASIYDACRLGDATIVRFRHNDPADLDKRLGRIDPNAGRLVVIEGLYSMLGDKAPIKEFIEVKKKHGATILVDEAHSMGVFGATGRGVAQEAGVEADTDFIVGTFSKSVGTIGGFCVSNHPKFNVLRLVCRPYMFTASLPPSVVASATVAIRKIQNTPSIRESLWRNANQLHEGLEKMGFDLGAAASPVCAVKIPDQEVAVAFWGKLLQSGIYVNLAFPPATPQGMNLLRCSLSAAHTPAQITAILGCFEEIGQEMGIIDGHDSRSGAGEKTVAVAAH